MKKLTKILLAAGGTALICGASVMTYLKAQTPMSAQEELTLANLDAMANDLDFGIDQETHVTCMGTRGHCRVSCAVCGGADYGKGSFRGSHKCSSNY
ncbi:hypothetical protein [uncultured Rikenella sp.]|uniref:hypothetical protein n=1 Tax=uncultured Rikenella sp. TaxID=368003 RepID=UPI002623572C|nr:hypothetical protein [uncultured Rikenella sp.]